MESALEPTNVSNVAGVSLSLSQNYSMMIEACQLVIGFVGVG